MNRMTVHAFLDSVEPYDIYELGILVESNPSLVNSPNEHGFFPLHMVAWIGDVELVGRLLDLGAHVDDRDAGGNTPLHLAAHRGHMAVIRLLLARGADVDARDGAGHTALFAAAHNGNEVVALTLLSHGACLFPGRPEGVQMLHAAAGNGMMGLVEAMLDADSGG